MHWSSQMTETKLEMKKKKKKKLTNKQINVLSLNKRMVILVYNQHGKEYVEVIENIKKNNNN